MENRRYSEGGSPPKLKFPNRQNKFTVQEALRKKRRTKWIVPIGDKYLSDTSDGKDCFVKRKNSKLLQQFALNYAYNIRTTRVLSGEV